MSLGIGVTGIVGVLLTAKEVGLISAIKPELDKLENKAGFWLGADFRRYVIELAKETE
jgi:predicted nucleic acid-binding protein